MLFKFITMQNISVQDFKKLLETIPADEAVDFINVCTTNEYKQAHIDGVRNLPLTEITDSLAQFSNKKKIYLHCLAGGRSVLAILELKKLGVSAELINVTGGITAWREAGFPLVCDKGN